MRVSTSGQEDVEQVEQSVVEWLRTELDEPEINASDNFLDVGGHSLAFSRLNKFLADSFGVVLDQRTTYSDSLSVAVAAAGSFGSDSQATR
jgi:acyl carrier protein